MSAWRRVALERLPKERWLKKLVGDARTPGGLWLDLVPPFQRYHDKPGGEDFIAGIYQYAAWCLTESQSLHVQIATLDCFFQRLPAYPRIMSALPRYLARGDFLELRAAFQRHPLTDEEFERLAAQFNNDVAAYLPAGFIDAIEARLAASARPWVEDCDICKPLAQPLYATMSDGERLPDEIMKLRQVMGEPWHRCDLLTSCSLTLRCPQCGRFYIYDYDYEFSVGYVYEQENIRPATSEEAASLNRGYPRN